ncbi:microtubule-associated protein 1-like, partial [Trifolium medium]|nr:microtubule-associated protein 1-like [Trifolium medium]
MGQALGGKNFAGIPCNTSGTIKEQLAAIAPVLEQLWQLKEQRIKDILDVQSQILKLRGEITGCLNLNDVPAVDESDLTLKKLEEYQSELQELQKEKVHSDLNDSTGAQSKIISDDTLARLANRVLMLKEDKKQRLHK